MNPRMASGLAMANCSPRQRSSLVVGSHRTNMVLAMKYGSHVTTKQPVVSMTTLMALRRVGFFPVVVVSRRGWDDVLGRLEE